MIITYWKGIFVVDHPEMPTELKRAGFAPHEPSLCKDPTKCKACRGKIGTRWWSNRVESATRLKSYCNQLALNAMKGHLAKLAESRATDANIQIPLPAGRILKPYQKAGVAYMAAHKDTLLADDMGLGKTPQALSFVNLLNPKNVLVLCPSTLVFNWRLEAEAWLAHPRLIVAPTNKRQVIPADQPVLAIVNYEKLEVDRDETGEPIALSPLGESLARVWDILITDEAHYLKTFGTKRYSAVLGPRGLMQRAHRTAFLTGTPIENYPKEIWSIAAAICPAKFGDWWEFARRYCGLHQEERGGRKVWVDTGGTNLGELQQRLRASFMIRRLKSDVLKELPPKRRQLIVLGDSKIDWSTDPDFRRWKELYEKDYEAKLDALEAVKSLDEYRTAARQLDEFTGVPFTEMSALRHKTVLAKLEACIKYIDDVLDAGTGKLVIFAHHQDAIEKLIEHFGDAAVAVYGPTTKAEREKAVLRFQQGNARIFIGSLKAASEGINLFAAATVIFIELDWNPAKVTQAEDRLCRIGQKRMVHVIQLVLDGTLDVNIVKRIMRKQAMLDKVLNREPDHGLPKKAVA